MKWRTASALPEFMSVNAFEEYGHRGVGNAL